MDEPELFRLINAFCKDSVPTKKEIDSFIGKGFETAFSAVHGALLSGIQGIAESIPLFGPVLSTLTQTSAFANALKLSLIGLTLDGAGKLLEKLGLSPKIIQTLYAGGKILIGIGMLASGNPMGVFTAAGLTGGGVTELLSLYTDLSPVVVNVISIGVTALTTFAAGYFKPGLKGIDLLKAAAPHLLADLASAGLSELGTRLGLDPRLTALINVPIRATVRGLTTTLVNPNGGGGPGGIFNSIKEALTNGQTLRGLVSVGASIGLEALGVPASATSFISRFLGQMTEGLAGGASGGGGPGDGDIETQGRSILSKIGEGLQKFGRGIVNGVGSIVSFGQKVVEGIGNVTVQGFKKAIGAFSSIFSRQTREGIYQDEVGLKSAAVSVNGDTWTWQNGGSRIDYNMQTGEAIESFSVGGTARITGLSQDEGGNIYYQALTYENVVSGGATLDQTYENGHLTGWTYGIEGTPILTLKCQGSSACMTNDGYIDQAVVEIDIPDDLNPSQPPVFSDFFFIFNIFKGKIAEASVEVRPTSGLSAPGADRTRYVLSNGINNWNTTTGGMPLYFENLKHDIVVKSNGQISTDDIISSAIYRTFHGIGKWGNRAKDVVHLLYNTQLPSVLQPLISQLKSQIAARYVSQGLDIQGQETIALGYSGGFAPLVKAISQLGMNISSLVGIGAATIDLDEIGNVLNFLGQVVAYIEDKVFIDHKISDGIRAVFNLIPFVGDNIGDLINRVLSLIPQSTKAAVHVLSEAVGKGLDAFGITNVMNQIPLIGLGSLANENMSVVNIYGDQDILVDLGIAGKMSNIAGFTGGQVFNIEIQSLEDLQGNTLASADHFIYVRGAADRWASISDPVKRATQREYDELVSNFVTELMVAAKQGKETLAQFIAAKAPFNSDKGVYEFRVF